MLSRRYLVWLLLSGMVVGGCGGAETGEPMSVLETVELPEVRLDGSVSLEEALAGRHSTRAFTDQELTLGEIGQLFWAAQGESRPGRRTSPSAGALYPLEVYVASADGLHHYLPEGHRAELLSRTDHRNGLFWAAYRQEAVRDAPAVFVICGVYARTEAKYGGRAERYVHLEAGHAAHGLLLEAVTLDLAAVPMGAFIDSQVRRVLAVPDDHQPLYLIPVGHPEQS